MLRLMPAGTNMFVTPEQHAFVTTFNVVLWALAQRSPRLFLAWLMAFVNPTPFDLVWEQAFALLRAMGFAWLLLWVGGRLLMPAVREEPVCSHPAHDAVAVNPPAPARRPRRRIAQFWLVPSFANIENTKRREDDVP